METLEKELNALYHFKFLMERYARHKHGGQMYMTKVEVFYWNYLMDAIRDKINEINEFRRTNT